MSDSWIGSRETTKFSDYGDNGALVYTLKDSVIIPLVDYIGCPQYGKVASIFLSLEPYVLEEQLRGLDLHFS